MCWTDKKRNEIPRERLARRTGYSIEKKTIFKTRHEKGYNWNVSGQQCNVGWKREAREDKNRRF